MPPECPKCGRLHTSAKSCAAVLAEVEAQQDRQRALHAAEREVIEAVGKARKQWGRITPDDLAVIGVDPSVIDIFRAYDYYCGTPVRFEQNEAQGTCILREVDADKRGCDEHTPSRCLIESGDADRIHDAAIDEAVRVVRSEMVLVPPSMRAAAAWLGGSAITRLLALRRGP